MIGISIQCDACQKMHTDDNLAFARINLNGFSIEDDYQRISKSFEGDRHTICMECFCEKIAPIFKKTYTIQNDLLTLHEKGFIYDYHLEPEKVRKWVQWRENERLRIAKILEEQKKNNPP